MKSGSEKKSPNISQNNSWLLWFFIFILCYYLFLSFGEKGPEVIPYSQFKQDLKDDKIAKLTIKGKEVFGQYKAEGFKEGEINSFNVYLPSYNDPSLPSLLDDTKIEIKILPEGEPIWFRVLISLIPWVLLIMFFVYINRLYRDKMGASEGIFGFIRSRARLYEKTTESVTFQDVAGLENTKKDLQDIIEFLRNPDKFHKLGANIPRGTLLMGPPGTGKTLLARATAGEANVPFFSISGSEFVELFVGVGASRVRNMFEEARKVAPSLIFIDEIDSVARTRGIGFSGTNEEREQTLNQILSAMDGFASNETVVVLAATNRPDVLDPALLRPGRFDRKLILELPHRTAREQILKIHTRKVPLSDDVDLKEVASKTVGFSGADLKNLANEAALRASRFNKTIVEKSDFEFARDKIVLGEEHGIILNDEEKKRIAYHEAGHTIISYLLNPADPPQRVTIIPHGHALGLTEQLPKEEMHNFPHQYLNNRICILLSGRSAEKIIFNEVSSGSTQDLIEATKLARKMIAQWGMNKNLGPVGYQLEEQHPYLKIDVFQSHEISENTFNLIDEEIRKLLNNSEIKVIELLTKHKNKLIELSELLLQHETLDGKKIIEILSKNLND